MSLKRFGVCRWIDILVPMKLLVPAKNDRQEAINFPPVISFWNCKGISKWFTILVRSKSMAKNNIRGCMNSQSILNYWTTSDGKMHPLFGSDLWSFFKTKCSVLCYTKVHIISVPSAVRMKSSDYSHLREKLSSPLTVARNVVIRQTLTDQFLTAFTEQMNVNGTYRIPAGSPVRNLLDSHMHSLKMSLILM